jgi:hypothetical protein
LVQVGQELFTQEVGNLNGKLFFLINFILFLFFPLNCSKLQNKKKYLVDDQVHDRLGDQVPDGLVDDAHVRVDEVPDRFDLALQLWVGAIRRLIDLAILF